MKGRRLLLVAGALATIGCLASTGSAQAVGAHALGPQVAYARVRLVSAAEGDRLLDGALFGGTGQASWWRLQLDAEYLQGHVLRGGSVSDGADIRVAEGLAGVRVLPWIVVHGGPRFFEVATETGRRRTFRWQAGASISVPLVRDWVHGFGAALASVAGTELDPTLYTGRGGAAVGVVLTPVGLPAWASIGYRMDREGTDAGVRSIEAIQIGIGWRGG